MRWLPLTAAGALALTLLASGGLAPTRAAAAPTLNVAVSTDPAGFDPQATAAASTFEITFNIYDTLATVDPKGNLVPDLATGWSVSDGGRTWTFRLRSGVRFSDGTALTSQVVKASFERLLSKAEASPWQPLYADIASISTPSPTVVQFHLSAPSAPFLANVASPWAAIVDPQAPDLAQHPVGTGPYELLSYVPGQEVTLVRNPYDWRHGIPAIPKVVFHIVPDPQTQLIDLKTGEVQAVPGIAPQDVAALKGAPGIRVVTGPSPFIQVLAMNEAWGPLKSLLVRRAINYAVNRQAVIQGAFFGYAVPIGTHMTPASPYYVNLTGMYPYNVAKAKALLAQAGYPHGFSVTITAPSNYEEHVRTAEIIAQELSAVGIRAQVVQVPWATWLSKVFMGRQYQMTVIAHTAKLDPDTLLSIYESTNPQDYMNYRSPAYDALIERARTTTVLSVRRALYAQAQRMLAENATAVYLDAPDTIVAESTRLSPWPIYPIDVLPVAYLRMR
ncbi:MAG: hypothetical protein K6V73_10255 [Firmicutes bacterium]|nr:hypothetical protein [Bacillota bacterium]